MNNLEKGLIWASRDAVWSIGTTGIAEKLYEIPKEMLSEKDTIVSMAASESALYLGMYSGNVIDAVNSRQVGQTMDYPISALQIHETKGLIGLTEVESTISMGGQEEVVVNRTPTVFDVEMNRPLHSLGVSFDDSGRSTPMSFKRGSHLSTSMLVDGDNIYLANRNILLIHSSLSNETSTWPIARGFGSYQLVSDGNVNLAILNESEGNLEIRRITSKFETIAYLNPSKLKTGDSVDQSFPDGVAMCDGQLYFTAWNSRRDQGDIYKVDLNEVITTSAKRRKQIPEVSPKLLVEGGVKKLLYAGMSPIVALSNTDYIALEHRL